MAPALYNLCECATRSNRDRAASEQFHFDNTELPAHAESIHTIAYVGV